LVLEEEGWVILSGRKILPVNHNNKKDQA